MMAYLNAVLVLLAWLGIAVYLLVNGRRIGYLKAVQPTAHVPQPSIALIIAVRNEAKNLRQALNTLTGLHYPNYKIILVDDGSTDGSRSIIEEFTARYNHIECIPIHALPGGWMGKSYALYQGYRHSSEHWLLFTDADVRFSADSLEKSIGYCHTTGAAHLTVLPYVRSRSWVVNCVNSFFQALFYIRYRPWATADKNSDAYLGMGAFNLVHRDAYETIGTHARFALHPNDDLKLGAHLKKAGFPQHVLYGKDSISYEWYSSLKDFITGLTKNAFSSVDYSIARVTTNALGALLLFVLPVPGFLLSGDVILQAVAVLIVLVQAILMVGRKGVYGRWWYALLIPFSALVIVFIMLRSAVLILANNGLYWSKRFYRLNDLKKFR
ncbi:Glycosyltransferase, catalytic subunit of cellulose synthase and poly-beta-1,6-N-acetylglucosamine synthase [Cnuella takakiae]|uniref:Glycosyltransferase, catalytic subunit of cellulose synthase and poly-beta-1,6-N-acetylglucosamine synthase n=1 Tax=Cnuella takakiae TaxID=1302690 RepID=A0A1M5BUP1_9BACT|nr:glycosyltransferase family 2 protein [Cnuella takakiae]OLY93525.1 hypothetical protein BUE76_17795 [Cnuella takakiae]SHF46284.1 Glycosyltransferase, catalytic subunit of cellulose synthase and poly-beta-1,6-N-acetylglucosamine synthase [Cnuella takakiae]